MLEQGVGLAQWYGCPGGGEASPWVVGGRGRRVNTAGEG
jgi:hypothetical protein